MHRIEMGDVLRPHELVSLPGGKGVNAARAAARLGGPVTTTGIAGGHAGAWIVEALSQEGLDPRFSTAAAESRTTYVVVADDGTSVIVYERPGAVTDDEYAGFLALLEHELLPRCGRAIVAGSVPDEVGPAGHAEIVEVCRRAGRPLLVDASGPGLVAVLERSPDIVKIGNIEAVEAGLVGATADAAEAAFALVDRGASLAIVTDGSNLVAAADQVTGWQVEVPELDAVNAVGSGDSFNAGLSLALMEGLSMEASLARGVAAGSANVLALAAGMLDPKVARDLEAGINVTRRSRS